MWKLALVACLAVASALPHKGGKKIVTNEPRPWERSGLYQGDIMLPEELKNVIIDPNANWPDRVVPVRFNGFNGDELNTIWAGLNTIAAATCIQFRDYQNGDGNFITVTGEQTGCWSYVGKQGGEQILNLQRGNPGCVFVGTAMHEFLHALGLFHQQSSFDRDDYVRINWENIQDGQAYNFDKLDPSQITNFGLPYDYDSIMHYGRTAFSKNGQDTITPYQNVNIGQSDHLSGYDVAKVRAKYGC